MAIPKAKPTPTPPPAVDVPPPADENDEDGSGYSMTESILADLTPEQIEGMEAYLDSKTAKPMGPNVACNGFFKKSPSAQLIGRVMDIACKPSRFDPNKEDTILFVQGMADFPIDVVKNGSTKVLIKKGRYSGTFGFQLDAGTMALTGVGPGTRVHLKVKELAELPSMQTRWMYDFVRTA